MQGCLFLFNFLHFFQGSTKAGCIGNKRHWKRVWTDCSTTKTCQLFFCQTKKRPNIWSYHQSNFNCQWRCDTPGFCQSIYRSCQDCQILQTGLSPNCRGTDIQMHLSFQSQTQRQRSSMVRHIQCRYGNTGCQVFKGGVQNWTDFCLKINIPKEKYWILRIGVE